MKEKTYNCPGHEGVCVFCKGKHGNVRYAGKGLRGSDIEVKKTHEVDPITHRIYTTMEPIIDYCCHYCGKNALAGKREYVRTSIS